jgi:hypothetical protein
LRVFGSQALETVVGLALLFFVLSSLASALVEGLSRLLGKRAKDLEATIGQMLGDPRNPLADQRRALELFRGTAIYSSAEAAAKQGAWLLTKRVKPSYLSARSFADAVVELGALTTPTGLRGLDKRVETLVAESGARVVEVKAGLESWFDETMSRLAESYKRWSTAVLFVVGLAVAVIGNVSTLHVTQALWRTPVLREAAVNAAQQTAAGSTVGENVRQVQELGALGLPIGWTGVGDWAGASWLWPHIGGWLVTALLLMLGAPFWFDVLSKVVALRSTGNRPLPATKDEASATAMLSATVTRSPVIAAPPKDVG